MATIAQQRRRNDLRVWLPEGKAGPWSVEQFTVEDGIELMRLRLRGQDCGMKPGDVYTRLIRTDGHGRNDPMMSDTPSEQRDHHYAIHEMKQRGGRVLINGLGIGMVLNAALAMKNVTHIDVVEIDADVISLVGPHYACDRLTIHHADAFTVEWPKDARWSVAWHDIWTTICTDNLPEMGKLHRKYGRRVEWQGSWQREYLQYQSRRDRASGW